MKLKTIYSVLKSDQTTVDTLIALDLGAKANIALYRWLSTVKPLLLEAEKALFKELDRFGTRTETGYSIPKENIAPYRQAESDIFDAFEEVQPLPKEVLESAESGNHAGITAKILFILEALSTEETE